MWIKVGNRYINMDRVTNLIVQPTFVRFFYGSESASDFTGKERQDIIDWLSSDDTASLGIIYVSNGE